MSEYPKKLVSDEGGVAMVNDAKDEATLKQRGYKDASIADELRAVSGVFDPRLKEKKPEPKKEQPKRKTPVRTPQLSRGPKKRKS